MEQLARMNCQGSIFDMRLIPDTLDMYIFSSSGLFRINKVIERRFSCHHMEETITCPDICFMSDCDTYIVAAGNTLVQRCLGNQVTNVQ